MKNVHARRMAGYIIRNRYSGPQPVYRNLCTVGTTHYSNLAEAIAELPAGTQITCQKCLRIMATTKGDTK